MVIVDQEEVIEITADFLRRVHGRIDCKFGPSRERREDVRDHTRLNPVGQAEFRRDALVLRCHGEHLADVGVDVLFHLRKAVVQFTDFIL